MNVLFISNNTSLYGANRSMLDIIQNLNPQKYKIYLLIPKERGAVYDELERLGIQYRTIRMFSAVHDKGSLNNTYELMFKLLKIQDNIAAIKTIMTYIKEWNIDVIHTNTSVLNVGAIAALLTKRKHVWHIRELEEQYGYRHDSKWMDFFLMKKSNRVICISKYVRKNLIHHYNHSNAIVIYNPIEASRYNITRTNYFINDRINILCCGVIHEDKGQMVVVKALKELLDRGCHNVKLTIVGGGINTDYGQNIMHFINENNMQDWIEVYPFCKDLTKYRRTADIAVMSSAHEALGRVTIESMFSELALIGADAGATEELIKDGYNGLKYVPDSEKELASKIEYVINHQEEAVSMIKNAKQFALKHFSAKTQVKKIEKVYEDK